VGIAITDMIMVAKLGESAMASVGLISHCYIFYFTFTCGLHAGAEALISNAFGASKQKLQNIYENHALLISLVTATIGLTVLSIMPGSFLNKTIGSDIDAYLKFFKYSIIPHYLFVSMRQILGASREVKSASYIVLIGFILNIGLNQFFIFESNMGIEGAGMATLVTRLFMFLALLVFFVKRVRIQAVFNLKILKDIYKYGGVGASNALIRSGVLTTAGLYIASGSLQEMSAHIILLNFATIIFTIYTGYGKAMSVLVGELIGVGMEKKILPLFKECFIQVTLICSLVFVMFYLNQDLILTSLNMALEVQDIFKSAFFLLPLFFFGDSIFWISKVILISLGVPKTATTISSILFAFGVLPMGLFLISEIGVQGLWVAMSGGAFAMAWSSFNLLRQFLGTSNKLDILGSKITGARV
jgi:MATE family multidrug resistance protein